MLQQLLHFAGVDISPGQRAGTGAVEHLDPVMKEAGPAIELVHQVKGGVLPVGHQAGEVADGVGMYGGGLLLVAVDLSKGGRHLAQIQIQVDAGEEGVVQLARRISPFGAVMAVDHIAQQFLLWG